MLHYITNLSSKKKYLIALFHDLLVLSLSFPIAIFIRLGEPGINEVSNYFSLILIAAACKIIALFIHKSYKGVWRFASTNDLKLIFQTATTGVLLSLFFIFIYTRLYTVPRSAFIIDWLLCIMIMGANRFLYRVIREYQNPRTGVKTLIIGAGRAGEQLIRDIKRNTDSNIYLEGILDDSNSQQKRTIHGIQVLGKLCDLEKYVNEFEVKQVIIAIPSATSSTIRNISTAASNLGLKVLTLPGINDIMDGKVQISQLRNIKIDDLLGRDPVTLDLSSLTDLLNNKTIMVTGGGGSIGSELCHQILKFGPSKLIIFDSCEYFIYKTHLELSEKFPGEKIIPVVGDVREEFRVEQVLEKYKPNLIFHAAAYKHVPMMERHPIEAIKTNVFGTLNVARLACEKKVERFVMISTDKAVNPTNVMGTTKRIAEQICQYMSQKNQTQFAIVRFGNVLGSNGSVVPRFMEQIENGGPVTVTHPEINRYFMSIPEACQLVLQASALSKGNEIFVLDMGSPVKIVDLAKDLIRLSGANEDEIEIKFTGLRPGEKLYEEVLASSEETIETPHKKIRIAKSRSIKNNLETLLQELLEKDADLHKKLQEIVPEYSIKK